MNSTTLPAGLNTFAIASYKRPVVTGIYYAVLLDALFPGAWPEYSEAQAAVAAWCGAHGAYHYAADREDFSTIEAAHLALACGHRLVVLEDLS